MKTRIATSLLAAASLAAMAEESAPAAAPAEKADAPLVQINAPEGLSLEGLLELSGSWTKRGDDKETDINMDTVELDFGWDVSDALKVNVNLLWEEGEDFCVDEAAFEYALSGLDGLAVRGGWVYMPFGVLDFGSPMVSDPLTLELLDPWNGVGDLRRGVLRHVSEHFAEDPLRVLRAMQFLARLPFLSPAPETVALCATMTQEALPRERLAGEWEKLLLQGAAPSRGLAFLRDCGWLRFYPELAALCGCPQDPVFHPEGDVWTHTLLALDAAAALRCGEREDDLAVAAAALCHDLGKPAVTARGEDGRWHAYEHEVRGVGPTRAFVRRLWNQPRFEDLVARLVEAHMRPIALVLSDAGDRAYRRLAVQVGRLDLLADVAECDVRATTPPGGAPSAHPSLALVRAFREKCAALAVDRAPPPPIVLGRHLLARGMSPGPSFGPILKECYEAQLAGEIRDEATGAAFLDALLAHREAGTDPVKNPRPAGTSANGSW